MTARARRRISLDGGVLEPGYRRINSMEELKYSDILRLNDQLGKGLTGNPYHIAVLSNITVAFIKELLEYPLRKAGVSARVALGDFDNVVQDSLKYKDAHAVLVFWELSNVMDGLPVRAELMEDHDYQQVVDKAKAQIDLVITHLKGTSVVLMNQFTAMPFSSGKISQSRYGSLAVELNAYLREALLENMRLIDMDKLISVFGLERSVDWRYYYSSKSLYTVEFFKAYAAEVTPWMLAVNGKSKKVLVFDCDNTLWKGILGEDGFDQIEMSAQSKNGVIFEEVQLMALALQRQGVLIGLCSKNNADEVDRVIRDHSQMVLRDEHITIKRVNWLDKVQNLKSIAEELDVGLDSIVFVDDSSFEVNLVRANLPQVVVLQVPLRLCDYPAMMRQHLPLFQQMTVTSEDRRKAELYRQRAQREKVRDAFAGVEDYLASLGIEVTVFVDQMSLSARMAQMTQKTNQFNLTARRYSEADIRQMVSDEKYVVLAMGVSDKYGDEGVVGLGIVRLEDQGSFAHIETYLMSCRVIGRNIEFAFIDHLVRMLEHKGVHRIFAKHIKTPRNSMVKDLYDRCGFVQVASLETETDYELELSRYKGCRPTYIGVKDGK